MDGVLIVDKPVGPTSHDIVAWARRLLATKRVGHAGTLDPAASGVLTLLVGQATRLAQFLASRDKEYVADVSFGSVSTTYDAEGTVTATGRTTTREEVTTALDRFRGTFLQTPPSFSAKKIDGVRAYLRARGEDPIVPAPVSVTVHRLTLEGFSGQTARLRVVCSAGFYVRSLAHDLGEATEAGALLAALERTRSGRFTLEEAINLDSIDPDEPSELAGHIVPMAEALSHLPRAVLTDEGAIRTRHGRDIGRDDVEAWPANADQGPVRLVLAEGRLLAIAIPQERGLLHPTVVLS